MRRLWQFLKDPQHLAISVAIGGLIGFLWTQFVAPRLNPPVVTPHPTTVVVPQYAIANGGTAVNSSGQAVVSVDKEPAPGSSAAPTLPPGQYTKAGTGSTAVNAADTSSVIVHHHVADQKK